MLGLVPEREPVLPGYGESGPHEYGGLQPQIRESRAVDARHDTKRR